MAGAVHPQLEYVVRDSVGAAAPAYVLADPIVRITIEGVAESLQSLFDCLAVVELVRDLILVEHLLCADKPGSIV